MIQIPFWVAFQVVSRSIVLICVSGTSQTTKDSSLQDRASPTCRLGQRGRDRGDKINDER